MRWDAELGVWLLVRLMRVLWVYERLEASFESQELLLEPGDWKFTASFLKIPDSFAPS
jgi:hypothetical protein